MHEAKPHERLDRCISGKAIDILEAIKLFLNVPSSVFVIGADKKRIEEGIIERYGDKSKSWGNNYLEKIVQIPFNLPPLRKDMITERFIQELNISNEIKSYAAILAEVGDNPRTIKRLLNNFNVRKILAKKRELKIDEKIMAKIAVIEFKWHDFYTDLIGIYSETKENLVKTLKEISESSEPEKEKKLKERENLKKYFEDRDLMDFLEEEPLLHRTNLEHYVYLARSTSELKESASNYFSIGYSFVEKSDYVKAIECFDKALELNPRNQEAWYNKGVCLGKLEKYEDAATCFDKALELNPRNQEAWYNKGLILRKLEKHEDAATCFDKALELNPKYQEAWYNKGLILGKLEKHEDAATCFDKALELNPRNQEAWYNKGLILGKLKKNEEAIECFDKALELNPNFREAFINKDICVNELERALELNPNFVALSSHEKGKRRRAKRFAK